MNKKDKYFGDTRYEKVWEQMKLLGIQDVTTKRQDKNGTIAWRLPIKNNWPQGSASYIEVASFSTGYVRNQNSGYSNYQLNKRCEGEPEYFDSGRKDSMGRPMYTKWTTRSCILIPIEIDRLEYLIKYCVKNYYIKHANQVPNGDFYPKWMYEDAEKQGYSAGCEAAQDMLHEQKQYENERVQAVKDRYKAQLEELEDNNQLQNLSVIVNGERYKII